jgi:hypothetical protein
VGRRFTAALFRSPVTAKAAIKGEVTFAIAGLKPGANAITFNLRPEHGGQALWLGGVSRVAAMFWIYWDIFWSLFFSAVWFSTIVSHPDAEVTETYR